ncbi:hypothetical protein K461DRAFT_85623 [Myriangium duriaei CBS 260.36]|uniref:C2H2-type domain-containing protein n=1 Tax=Myriangium duriaei CBS 260.36 TaxID=1168546 RepID=A0A9P4J9K2_9PEZI|nr:hypothetical protein K461DRAFT_85623 [Myriangium duriaei CBS 260.36]
MPRERFTIWEDPPTENGERDTSNNTAQQEDQTGRQEGTLEGTEDSSAQNGRQADRSGDIAPTAQTQIRDQLQKSPRYNLRCPYCDKAFIRRHNVRAHMMVHESTTA